jgi:nicotinamide-nucleotide adenylyltransferase
MIDTGAAHGRFQILHRDHLAYLLAAKARCRHLVIGITNPDPTLTKFDPADPQRSAPERNPLTYYERYQIIKAAFIEQGFGLEDFSLVPLPINFPELYQYYVPLHATFFLTIYDEWGERKLQLFESLGLKTEILWRKSTDEKGLTSTQIRLRIAQDRPWEDLVPPATVRMLKALNLLERIARLSTLGPKLG